MLGGRFLISRIKWFWCLKQFTETKEKQSLECWINYLRKKERTRKIKCTRSLRRVSIKLAQRSSNSKWSSGGSVNINGPSAFPYMNEGPWKKILNALWLFRKGKRGIFWLSGFIFWETENTISYVKITASSVYCGTSSRGKVATTNCPAKQPGMCNHKSLQPNFVTCWTQWTQIHQVNEGTLFPKD